VLFGLPIADVGGAYLFVEPGGGWVSPTQTAKLAFTWGSAAGRAVALSGDTALLGAPSAAYVFVKPGGGWADTQTINASLTASDSPTGFGIAVALDGDTAVVGAYGSAYVFMSPGGWGSGTETGKVTPTDGSVGDFGESIGLSGDTLLIGQSSLGSGSAYFYEPYTPDLAASASFGVPSALPGDTVYLTAWVSNLGPTSTASSLTVSAPFPAGLTSVLAGASLGSYDLNTGEWNLPDMAAGASAALTIQATVDADPPQNITFTASIPAGDPNSANDTASDTLAVTRSERISNGGFEVPNGILPKIPNEWTAVKFSSKDGLNTTTKQEGTASVRISGQSGKTKTLTQDAPVIGYAGDSVTFSFYAKSASVPSSGKCMGTVTLMNGLTKVMAKTLKCSNGSTAFKLKKVTFTASGAYDHAIVKFTYSKPSGSVYFDAASLMR
jgi:hypothetical protein